MVYKKKLLTVSFQKPEKSWEFDHSALQVND